MKMLKLQESISSGRYVLFAYVSQFLYIVSLLLIIFGSLNPPMMDGSCSTQNIYPWVFTMRLEAGTNLPSVFIGVVLVVTAYFSWNIAATRPALGALVNVLEGLLVVCL